MSRRSGGHPAWASARSRSRVATQGMADGHRAWACGLRAGRGPTPPSATALAFSVLLALALGGCARDATARPAALGVDQAPGWIPPAVEARAVDFHGTCNWGRHPGPPEQYRVPLRAAGNPSGTIPVRSDARFDAGDDSNVIGELPAGTRVLGDGPLAGGGEVGYAILVRGHTGRVCRGYVSATSVLVEQEPGHPGPPQTAIDRKRQK